ncbi:unnamed protein product [Spodoptera exigua]|nr:unnamed protein product [Spodoptera exigua]
MDSPAPRNHHAPTTQPPRAATAATPPTAFREERRKSKEFVQKTASLISGTKDSEWTIYSETGGIAPIAVSADLGLWCIPCALAITHLCPLGPGTIASSGMKQMYLNLFVDQSEDHGPLALYVPGRSLAALYLRAAPALAPPGPGERAAQPLL